MSDHRASAFHNICRRAVVPFELKERYLIKIMREVSDDFNVCTAPSVNTLVVVAHNRHVLLRAVDQKLEQFILDIIRILIFVHDHILKTVCKLRRNLRELLQKFHRIHQKVVKIHRVRIAKLCLIIAINSRHLLLIGECSLFQGDRRSLQDNAVTAVRLGLFHDAVLVLRNDAASLLQLLRIHVVAK